MHDALFGMETELAFSAWHPEKAERAVGDRARERLVRDFYSVAERQLCTLPDRQAPGVFLENGSRVYLDAGLHPEFCTPECRSPEELVRWQLAGERIVVEVGQELEKLHPKTRVAFFRCNVDYSGSGETWGCHESYQHCCDPTQMSQHLIPHLASRIVYTGAGGFNNQEGHVEFLLSPRVPHLAHDESNGSQSGRGLYHTKNEPLGRGGFNRLHLICGESNSSQLSNYLKFGTTALIVRLIDFGRCRGNQLRFENPRSAMYAYARDPGCSALGELHDGRRMTAVQVQREYLEMVEENIDADFMPEWAPQVCERWRRVLDQLETAPSSLSTQLDWAIKHALLQDRVSRSGASWEGLSVGKGTAAELCEIDTRFGELGPRGLFHSLDRAGILDHALSELGSVEEAMTAPPPGGRAEVRGRAIRELQPDRGRYRCSWEFILDLEEHRLYDMSNSFGHSPGWRDIETSDSERSSDAQREQMLSNRLHRGIGHYHQMELSQASRSLRALCSLAGVAGDHEIEARARFWLATAQMDLGNLDAAETALTPILESVDQIASAETACRVWTRYAMILLDRPSERSRIEEVADRVRSNFSREDDDKGRSRLSLLEGRIHAVLGRYDQAIESMERALEEQRSDTISFSRSSYLRRLVSYLLRAGEVDRAGRYVRQWRRHVQNTDPVHHEIISQACAESTIARLRGQHPEAIQHAQTAVARACCSREPNRYRLTAYCALIESAVAGGETEVARSYVEDVEAWGEIQIGQQRLDVCHATSAFYRAETDVGRTTGRKRRSSVVSERMCELAEQTARTEASTLDSRLGTTHRAREIESAFRPAG
jgi:tetratricopeptide (TPR) repeat protein